ncbi:AAA family ATPase [Bacillus cereus group sp. BY32LC]|uniref:AAA family ATPase n=1 Tax=Bacillus cereus group sp. BY32LC TaxID=3018079 RepID=UPI0022E10F41|nr:AAA family ATPase [Bacillus cereus group sp. BY32LC]MDA1806307.1 AAA family ATPase [Bacillus cereus group sp. BY32LC]
MELIYMWIGGYRNIKNQEFNFSNKYICELDKEQNINVEILQNEVSEDFFKLDSNNSAEKNGRIVNITGIIGENGVGKSSILDYIIEKINSFISGEFRNFEEDEQILAIVREENKLCIYVNSINVNQITIKDPRLVYEIIKNNINLKSTNHKVIYYSNIFDAKKDYDTAPNIIDISTNHLLNKNENYRLSEIHRQLNLIAGNIKVDLPFKYPDFLNCNFSPFFYLSEIVLPESPYDFEDIAFQVFSNYFNTGTWMREAWNSRAAFDMYNLETNAVIDCVYKEYDSEERNIGKKYRELYQKVKNNIFKSMQGESKIHFNNLTEYCIVTNLPHNPEEERLIREKIKREFDKYDSVRIKIYFWDDIVEFIESIPSVRQAYFKLKNVNEKIKIDMLKYEPKDKELKEFIQHALAELNSVNPYGQLKIRICLSYFLVFYRTNHKEEIFRANWEEEFMRDLLERRSGTVASIINFFVAYEGSNDYWKSRLGNFIECLDKLVDQESVFIDESGQGFKLMIQGENIDNYQQLICKAYNESQEVFPQAYDFLNFDWYDMSSGEKAIFNLISRFYNALELVGDTEDLLILIDEGETYFHPEWQRRYIYMLLEALPRIFSMKNIQIIFTSNTPLVISDLPRENIVFLERKEGICYVRKSDEFRKTFGANIHTLFSDSFFMKNEIIGKFAKEKIEHIIDLLNKDDEIFKRDVTKNKINLKKIKREILVIGERLIRNKLVDMYNRKIERIGFEEEGLNNTKNKIMDLQQMTNEDLQKFKNDIENVLRKREFNDKGKN